MQNLCNKDVDVYKYFEAKPEKLTDITVDYFFYEANDLCKSLECIGGLRKQVKKNKDKDQGAIAVTAITAEQESTNQQL